MKPLKPASAEELAQLRTRCLKLEDESLVDWTALEAIYKLATEGGPLEAIARLAGNCLQPYPGDNQRRRLEREKLEAELAQARRSIEACRRDFNYRSEAYSKAVWALQERVEAMRTAAPALLALVADIGRGEKPSQEAFNLAAEAYNQAFREDALHTTFAATAPESMALLVRNQRLLESPPEVRLYTQSEMDSSGQALFEAMVEVVRAVQVEGVVDPLAKVLAGFQQLAHRHSEAVAARGGPP